MSTDSSLQRFIGGMVLVFAGLSLSGVNYCQQNYSIGSQTEIAATASVTPTDDGELITETPSVDPTSTFTATAAATSTSTPKATATPTLGGSNLKSRIFQSLASDQQGRGGEAASARSDKWNWLGQIAGDEAFLDADRDGYSDSLEDSLGSLKDDARSGPPLAASRLPSRMRGSDDDMDGLLNSEEYAAGTSGVIPDTDGDGVTDGAEVLSGSSPLKADSLPFDEDGDGLSSELEKYLGLNPAAADSDGDGLRDDLEISLGANPLKPDSDRDGIADGREFTLGNDPLVKDWAAK